ncbi:hypothetical protein TruAng_006602 [Truncatella angustata]|nr:hypothetical protein TruAng_006602 [Truncatella angustata]
MEDKSATVIAILVVFFVLSYVAVGLRTFTRLRVNQAFGVDDVMIIVNLAAFTAYLAAQIEGWRHGLGHHESQLTSSDRSIALMWWYVCFLLYIVNVCLFKIAVGLFLQRIAVEKFHIWTLRLIMVGVPVCGTAYFFMCMFQCHPPSAWWLDSPRALGKCWDDKIVFGMDLAASIVNCSGDWVLGILPIFMVKSLQMQRRSKVLVGCLLSFAAVGSTATVIRIFYLKGLLRGDDFLFFSTEVAYLSTIECGIGITAVSLGTLKPLVERWRGTMTMSSNSNGPSWSLQNRANPRRSYVRADGSDRAPTPKSRLGSIFHISKSEHSASNTVSSVSYADQDVAPIPAATSAHDDSNDNTAEARQSDRPRNTLMLSVPLPPPAVLPSAVFVSRTSNALESSS